MADDELDPARFAAAFKGFVDAVVAAARPPASPLLDRMAAHLEVDLTQLPVIAEEYDAFDHPNVQVALDDYIGSPGRQSTLIGIGAGNKRFMSMSLSDLLAPEQVHGNPLSEGPVDYVNFRLARGRILSCVDLGLFFIRNGDERVLVFVAGATEHGPRQKLRVEVVSARPEDAQAFLAELASAMERLNVYRGQVISISPGQFGPGPQSLIAFHTLPEVARGDVILPEGVLERVERHTIVFAEQAERLRAAGRSLKRGLLLYGPPGVGKTLTVQYLTGQMPGRTVLLTSGLGLGYLGPVMQLARTLAPSMVVLEDVDLIAEERGMPFGHSGPLLFELLNEMDGLQEDSDVIFVLTTNRPDILEPALAARPGRIDLAVELPLPDAAARRRLLELYARGLELQDIDLDEVAQRIEGATPAYIKELLRKAAVLAAIEGTGMVVTGARLETALSELDEGGRLAHRLLGFRASDEPDDHAHSTGAWRRSMPSGFPPGMIAHTEISEKG
jgi:DNA polymerase III delta prime subunit